MNRGWKSLHMFYHDSSKHDDLLTEMIYPCMSQLKKQNKISGWFFIRYWLGGPHLRLRLKGLSDEEEEKFVSHLQKKVDAAPSAVDIPKDSFYQTRTYYGEPEDAAAQEEWYPNNSIQKIKYKPEIERYGGERAIDLSEELFHSSSEIAIKIIAATEGNQQQKLLILLDLFILTARILNKDDRQAGSRLRQYAFWWFDKSPHKHHSIQQAEHKFHDKEKEWAARTEQLKSPKQGLYLYWKQLIQKSHTQYRQLDIEEDRIHWIYFSQLHMLSNRIGVTPENESYVAYLASLLLEHLSGVPSKSYSALYYHNSSKYHMGLMEEQMPLEIEAKKTQRYVEATIYLPEANAELMEKKSITELLEERRSGYGTYHGSLTESVLSTLLKYSAGVSKEVPYGGKTFSKRTYPSGGAMYGVDLYLYIKDVEGIAEGVYRYDSNNHQLELIKSGDFTESIQMATPFTGLHRSSLDITNVPIILFLAGNLAFKTKKYQDRAYRLLMLEAGHIAQNFSLVSTSLGLKTITIGGFYDNQINQIIGIDGFETLSFYMMPFGVNSNFHGGGDTDVEFSD